MRIHLKTAEFYDIRGRRALAKPKLEYGSQSIASYLSAPYQFAEKLLPSCKSSSLSLLDLCCGAGIHSILPAKNGYQVTGIDLSPHSIDAARLLAKSHDFDDTKCRFSVADGVEFLSKCAPFDVIFMSGSLYYFELDKLLPLLDRALKPGGHLICVETNGSNPIMNALRPLLHKGGDRDERTLNHLLTFSDTKMVSKYFKQADITYFDFLTLAGVLVKKVPWLLRWFLPFARKLDFILLNKLHLKFLSFKFVFHGIKGA